MRSFKLLEPRSIAEACSMFATEPAARPIAGGTALLTILKQGLMSPETLLNLKKIPDGGAISFDPVLGLRIGALATIHEIETSPLVRERYPLLAEACHWVANIRIRNMASIGGNLGHGDYQSDPPAALAVLDANVELTSRRGIRNLKLTQFQRGMYETAVESGELITAISIPPLAPDFKGVYLKFTTGSSEERPCAGVAALARMENGLCGELRLAVGALSPIAIRITAAEQLAAGRELSPELLKRLAAETARSVDPIDDLRGSAEYKRHLVGVLVRRAITGLIQRLEERLS